MVVISKQIIDLLQYRIEQEEQSSRLYLAMSIWLEINGYTGAASLWKKYSEEERTHIDWAIQYLLDLNVLPKIPSLQQPSSTFKGLPNIIALSYEHELQITEQCRILATVAASEKDYMTLEFAQKYLKEQREEIAKTQYWIDRLETFGDSKEALRLLDIEMGEAV